jgi:phosphatidylglycerol---prolipoprotein diacylglyceryl transferase
VLASSAVMEAWEMGRAERRRADRQQRRRTRSTGAPARPSVVVRPSDTTVGHAVLAELDRQKVAHPTGAGSGRAAAPPRAGAAKRPAAVTTAASLRATSVSCSAIEAAEPQALGLTYTFEAAEDGEAYPLTIRFDGRRTGATGKPAPQDAFTVVETIERVEPGTGHVTLTKRIDGIAPGDWEVTATPVPDAANPMGTASRPIPSRASASGATGFAPLVRVHAPGVRIGAWPGLVGSGAVVALTVQALLATRIPLPVTPVLLLSLLACLIGLVGAKVYYLVEHPRQPRGLMSMTSGMCIQGFVLAAIATLVVGALIAGLPVGPLLDVTAPGLLFGMAIGRVGCFFGGCCAGRPTRWRWGLWSSDRRLGARRVPTQLFESTLALLVGLAALVIVLTGSPQPAGVVFVAALAAYILGRQLLFPLRDLPRNTSHGRVLTAIAAGLVLVAALAVTALA